ncbi:hypothetical protein [Actinomadura fibrosa]|uniref:Uncharacterized protein n=1 Tax=Actinomadura fibrosa TaxID=111802 RepID=A0ABW2Y155_9ACTN|nr:hypothetical protein [Actinomadura fibrosa]
MDGDLGGDVIAMELAEVPWPWDVVGGDIGEAAPKPAGTREDVRSAIHALGKLLEFPERRSGDVAAASAATTLLDDAPWFAFEGGLAEAMPATGDLTWSNVQRWAQSLDPALIGTSWEQVPAEFVRAIGWIWASTVVDVQIRRVTSWLIDKFKQEPGSPELDHFMDLVAGCAPKVGVKGPRLIVALASAGQSKALPYLDRLARDSRIPEELQEVVEQGRAVSSLSHPRRRGVV